MTKNEQLTMFQVQNEEIYEKGREECRKQKHFLESIGKKLQEERAQLVQKMKPEIIEFCLELSEQLLRQELSKPELLAKKISSLLDALSVGQEAISVILAPEDLESIEGDKQKWGSLFFCADPSLERGDIRIESSAIVVNCALKRELANVRAHLKGES